LRYKKYLWVIVLLTCLFAVSCTADDPGGEMPGRTENEEEKVKITPAEYWSGELTYDIEISDGKRAVCLRAVRKDGVTEAKLTSPEGVCGIGIVSDAGGVRLSTANGELLGLTEEAAAGLRAYFEALEHRLEKSEKTAEGTYSFEVSGYEATVLLTSEGYPRLVTLSQGGNVRHGEITLVDESTQ